MSAMRASTTMRARAFFSGSIQHSRAPRSQSSAAPISDWRRASSEVSLSSSLSHVLTSLRSSIQLTSLLAAAFAAQLVHAVRLKWYDSFPGLSLTAEFGLGSAIRLLRQCVADGFGVSHGD